MVLNIKRGDDYSMVVTVTDDDTSLAVDITGWTITFTAKASEYLNDTDNVNAAIFKVVTSHTDPTIGITHIVLSNIDTNVNIDTYYYDVQFEDTTGAIHTPAEHPDLLRITNDITK